MEERESSFGSMLMGLIIGGLVGFAAGLLAAPRSGEETRVMLEEKGREVRHKATETLQDTRAKTEQLIATGREKVEKTVSQTKDRAVGVKDQVKEQGQSFIEEKRAEVSEGLHRVADKVDPNNSGENLTPSI